MDVVFMGTPDFAIPALDLVYSSTHRLLAAVTQPDRPKGRRLQLQPSPVKEFAQRNNIPLFQPDNLNEKGFRSSLCQLDPEAVVVVAYGKIIPEWILDLPPHGCINVHASLLPQYRGAAPIQRAIMDGCTRTGVTTMLLDRGMDTGPILLQAETSIELDDTAGTVAQKLADQGAELLVETLDGVADGIIEPREQDENGISYAPKIKKEETLVQWSSPAKQIKDKIRALNPYPGAYTFLQGKRLKLLEARINEQVSNKELQPGTVVAVEKNGLVVATQDRRLILTMIQPENKRKMSSAEFLRGHQIKLGQQLG